MVKRSTSDSGGGGGLEDPGGGETAAAALEEVEEELVRSALCIRDSESRRIDGEEQKLDPGEG